MAVAIRLKRLGTKKKLRWRIVVCDKRRARDSKFLEDIGSYDPSREPPRLTIRKERAKYWLSKGALPSEIVRTLLKKEGVI